MLSKILLEILVVLLLAGCQVAGVREAARSNDAGELLVYMQPVPAETGRLHFSLQGLAAVRDDGVVFPLDLQLKNVIGRSSRHQRLLGSGFLPEGNYLGLNIVVGSASVTTEDGEMQLSIPVEPVRVNSPFSVARHGSLLLAVSYRHEGSIVSGFRFEPAFLAYRPSPPLLNFYSVVSSPEAGRLTVIDRYVWQATGVLDTAAGATGLAYDERTRRLYAAFSGEDLVRSYDLPGGTPVGRITFRPGDQPEHLALSNDGRLLLAVNRGSNSVSIIDPHTMIELARVPVGDEPLDLLIERNGQRAFTFNSRSNSITLIDLVQYRTIVTIPCDSSPWRGALSRDGSRLYVLHKNSPHLSIYDAHTLSLRDRLPIGIGGAALLVDVNSDLLYLGRFNEPRIDIYNQFSDLPVDFIAVPAGVVDMSIDNRENRLLLLSRSARALLAVNLASKHEVGRVELGATPHSLALTGERH